eukprot:scpid109007/ scgid14350/ 
MPYLLKREILLIQDEMFDVLDCMDRCSVHEEEEGWEQEFTVSWRIFEDAQMTVDQTPVEFLFVYRFPIMLTTKIGKLASERSFIWGQFLQAVDNKVICSHRKRSYSYTRGTMNLQSHLRTRHPFDISKPAAD